MIPVQVVFADTAGVESEGAPGWPVSSRTPALFWSYLGWS